jgi:hypothetical protein
MAFEVSVDNVPHFLAIIIGTYMIYLKIREHIQSF